jgi:hypothetical protein
LADSARYVSHGRITPTRGGAPVYPEDSQACHETRMPLNPPAGYPIRVSWQGAARTGSCPASPIFTPCRLNLNPRLGPGRYVSHGRVLAKLLRTLGLWFRTSTGWRPDRRLTRENRGSRYVSHSREGRAIRVSWQAGGVRIRVSWQVPTCLMAGWRRPDTCLMAGSYVSHGTFFFLSPCFTSRFRSYKITKQLCNKNNNRKSHVETICCCFF